jgi:hypothetical protein
MIFASTVLATTPVSAGQGVVTVGEASVRSAPFDVAPEMLRVHASDPLSADDQPQGDWRRVRLPDGRFGYLHDADVKVTPAPPPAASAAPQPGTDTKAGPRLEVEQPKAPPPQLAAEPTLVGVMFALLPVGTLAATSPTRTQNPNLSADSVFAVAVAPFVDVPLSREFAIGASPQVIFRVKADGAAGESSKEFDLRARFTGRMPLSPKVRVYGRLSPAYSIISQQGTSSSTTSMSDPSGFLIDFAVGSEVALLPNLFLVVDLGYQLGFQSSTSSDGSTTFDGSRYLHLGAGLAVAL